MNYACKNYLYIYNITLIEENTLLIEKEKTQHPNIFFVLLALKTFLLIQPKMFFFLFFRIKTVSRIQFLNTHTHISIYIYIYIFFFFF